jgi:hypothetical protein
VALVTVIEFYNAALDHYFVSWIPDEIQKLVQGTVIKGWQPTGNSFTAYNVAQSGASSVCRYYIPPAAGNSHFYGRGAVECNATGQNNPTFILEDANFMTMLLPAAGTCPAGTTPIYRVFSNRADANHRYMTDLPLRNQMTSLGWIAEGDGTNLVVMCAPSAPPKPPPPQCGVSASSLAPLVGTSLTLTAVCANNPTGYTWTNCTSSGPTCTTTRATAGLVTYTLVANNAAGSSEPVSVSVNWSPPEGAAPQCTFNSSNLAPPVGTSITLTASCTNNPSGYTWTNCTSNGPTCTTTRATAGSVTYTLVASNAAGSSPPFSVSVNWQADAGSRPECSVETSNPAPQIDTSIKLTATCTNNPTGYTWTNCISSSSTCNATRSTAGNVTYTVVGNNAAGSSAPAFVSVDWQSPPSPP